MTPRPSLPWLFLFVLLLTLGTLHACSPDSPSDMNPDMAVINPTLTVTSKGTGMGSVSSAPAGISCAPTCQASFSAGTQVTLTATPSAGSFFTAWDGACSGSTPTCTVTLTTADQQVGATFDLNPSLSALTVSAGVLSPIFAPNTLAYTVQVPAGISTLQLTPTTAVAGAIITVNGMQVSSGMASQAIPLGTGVTMINVVVSLQGMSRT